MKKRGVLLRQSYKIDDEDQDIIEDEEKEEVEENTFITQIQTLERTVDEFVGLDNDIIGSLTKKEKKQMKSKLVAIAEKLDAVMKRL